MASHSELRCACCAVQVHHQLTQLASVLQPVMALTLFQRFLNQLLDAVLSRCCNDVLSLRDISVDETVHVSQTVLYSTDHFHVLDSTRAMPCPPELARLPARVPRLPTTPP